MILLFPENNQREPLYLNRHAASKGRLQLQAFREQRQPNNSPRHLRPPPAALRTIQPAQSRHPALPSSATKPQPPPPVFVSGPATQTTPRQRWVIERLAIEN